MNNQYVGLLTKANKGGIVELDKTDKELGRTMFVPEKHLHGAPFGTKVVVKLVRLNSDGQPEGEIIEVLGDPARPDVAIAGIMRQYGLVEAFPDRVLKEVEWLPSELSEEDIEKALQDGYIDLRELNTITIDGEDAKDLDDAIDIEILNDKLTRLYVHIADVSHYVRSGTALDEEAKRRGNSVYLVDRVLPMLPPKLSNGLCSINPGVVRLAMTCEMDIDQDGHVHAYKIYNSLIENKVRASYREVKSLLDGEPAEYERPSWFIPTLESMRTLALQLEAKRVNRGTLEFNFPETKVDLDEEGHPIDIYAYPVTYANSIIEEFMIVANETIAEHLVKNKLPGMYRVHEDPDPERLQMFSQLASRLGLSIRAREGISPKALGDVLKRLKGKPFELTLSQMLLRSLAKADYRESNQGHFGLASRFYLHFTAPIRRYADIVVHRSLKTWLSKSKARPSKQMLADIAHHISETERTAVSAERDSVDQKAAEYFQDKIGEAFDGVVSGFSKSAFFVQLENTVEGAVFYRTLDGYYEYDETRLAAENRSGDSIHIGDKVRVKVVSVDINRRFIDFALVDHDEAVSSDGPKKVKKKTKEKAAKRLKKSHISRDRRRRR